jgi:hypothetical protein
VKKIFLTQTYEETESLEEQRDIPKLIQTKLFKIYKTYQTGTLVSRQFEDEITLYKEYSIREMV